MNQNGVTNSLNMRSILQNDNISANTTFQPYWSNLTTTKSNESRTSKLLMENFDKWISNNVPPASKSYTTWYVVYPKKN